MLDLIVADQVNGLSPRVRGNPYANAAPPRKFGSIPACAGEPRWRGELGSDDAVYPRVCGGTRSVKPRGSLSVGLSPRVRGNPHPAPPSSGDRKVYPRVCGGTDLGNAGFGPVDGLSPRVRGNLSPVPIILIPGRSIPACAGEPVEGQIKNWDFTVYPRVCGGTGVGQYVHYQSEGLSPRVRGNPHRNPADRGVHGSIPACAGEPARCLPMANFARVYPRVCGGTVLDNGGRTRDDGLSPRVRGNPGCKSTGIIPMRSIPACAGEPNLPVHCRTLPRVYPRVCGGTSPIEWARYTYRGLSPRVRGNPEMYLHPCASMRSIPACAGEPSLSDVLPRSIGVYPRVCGGTDVDGLD